MSLLSKRFLFLILIILLSVLIIIFISILFSLPRLPEDLHDIELSSPTEIYSDTGELVAVLSDRQSVKLSQISDYFLKAILAMEDAEFYKHHGINKKGLLRAVFTNLRHLRIVEGGSSITQQLVKNLFFSFERQWSRKIKEMLVAIQMEQQFSKEEILESYCNQIYFGSNAYGIELASQIYFAKHADELSLAEAAFLANLPRWPSHYNPYQNFDIAKQRQHIVLKRMVDTGFITQQEMDKAFSEPLNLKRLNLFWGKATYYVEYIKGLVENIYSREILYYGGLKIYTTLDTRLQNFAQEAIQKGLAQLDKQLGFDDYELAPLPERKKYLQAALVAIDPRTGKVKAMVGGRDFAISPFNRAIENNRQPGSAFKPFTYLTAIDQGKFSPASIIVDSAVTFKFDNQSWSPPNFDHKYRGPITLKTALSHSINVVAAKLINKVGPENVVNYAHKMGITTPLETNLSLALGTSGVSPLEMATAYAVFANGGIAREPQFLKYIENPQGVTIKEFSSHSDQVVDPQSVYLVIDMLKSVVEQGTAKRVRWMGFDRPCAGKTGTTNDAKDAWFIGFTPQLVTAVWVGFDDPHPIRDKHNQEITGSRGAIPVWINFMKRALREEPYRDFTIPAGIIFVYVDPKTGEIVPKNFPDAQQVAIKAGTELPRKNITSE